MAKAPTKSRREAEFGPFAYWCELAEDREDGGYVVTFPDFPEAVTQADDESGVLAAAQDCLEEAIASRVKAREDVPSPGPRPPGVARVVSPGSLIQAKAALWRLMQQEAVSPVQLAKMMNRPRQDVTRLLDPRHGTNHQLLDQAFRSLNRRLILTVEAA